MPKLHLRRAIWTQTAVDKYATNRICSRQLGNKYEERHHIPEQALRPSMAWWTYYNLLLSSWSSNSEDIQRTAVTNNLHLHNPINTPLIDRNEIIYRDRGHTPVLVTIRTATNNPRTKGKRQAIITGQYLYELHENPWACFFEFGCKEDPRNPAVCNIACSGFPRWVWHGTGLSQRRSGSRTTTLEDQARVKTNLNFWFGQSNKTQKSQIKKNEDVSSEEFNNWMPKFRKSQKALKVTPRKEKGRR